MNSDLSLFQIAQAATPAASTTQTTAAPTGAGAPPVSPLGSMSQFLPLVLIFGILYFMMIRPAQRKEKERKKEIDTMRAGCKVLFSGGIIGTITEVKDATFMVKVADGVVFEISRGAVQRVITNDNVAVEDAR